MSHEAEERYDVYDERRRVAACSHTCDACKETIRRGDMYYAIGLVWDRTAWSYKRCLRCQQIHEHLRSLGHVENMWPDERLDCGEEYREHWGCEPPPEIAALAFKTADEIQGAALANASPREMAQVIRRFGG